MLTLRRSSRQLPRKPRARAGAGQTAWPLQPQVLPTRCCWEEPSREPRVGWWVGGGGSGRVGGARDGLWLTAQHSYLACCPAATPHLTQHLT